NSPCVCGAEGSPSRLYRCNDCTFSKPQCRNCILSTHNSNPLHWIEFWNGRHFEKMDLSAIGMHVRLMHHGESCRHNPSTKFAKTMSVVHTNGVHEVKLVYCACIGHIPEFLQLFAHRLFPSSTTKPRLCFTFDVLKDFHVHSLTSKKSAYDYMRSIRRKTNALVSSVPDMYTQMIRIMRLWRSLAGERRSGQALDIDNFVQFRPKGSFAMPCFCCAIWGFNMSHRCTEDPKELEKAENQRFENGDGNYHLCHMVKNNDPSPFNLSEERGCLCSETKMEKHVEKHGSDESEKSSCAELSVVANQNKKKSLGRDVSGVFSILCARHGVVEPNGTVDLQKGERYVNVDYALARVLEGIDPRIKLVFSYDVGCQYCINIVERFTNTAPHLVPRLQDLRVLVGKMHLQGHIESCQYRFSWNYTDGVGRTDGEEVERFWAEANQAAGSTKQMNKGHRREVLDDIMNDWNFLKNEAARKSLLSGASNIMFLIASTQIRRTRPV
ncbi:hypothetical protein SCHPADRAFT_841060, partial [Schizopora paradoxa]